MSGKRAVADYLKANDRAYEKAMKGGDLHTAFRLISNKAAVLRAAGLVPRVAPPG